MSRNGEPSNSRRGGTGNARQQPPTRKLNLPARARERFWRIVGQVLATDMLWSGALIGIVVLVLGVQRCGPEYERFEVGQRATQDIKAVARLAPELFGKGIHKMLRKTGIDISRVKCFFANIPTKHFMDLAITNLRKDFQNPDLPFYTRLNTRGYQGAPSIIIGLDDYMKEASLDQGDYLVSFVTESSKWMNAGFVLEYT